ncbi:hypothetical protein F4821DRAFT_274304 [Hypoxylon rubiginosum]|uniref:Uncharacterized protein n=1 Tax=Hypoxylon rubiginosum TaxID=110542 RepID=A0ACC0DDV3_9PEZI|nr:hypothetical protein F4821DRAFT_274304 [Hypoxylon rubiginosum]
MAYPEQVTFLAVEVVIVVLRIYVRWVDAGPGSWQVDDYLMPLVGIVSGCLIWTEWFVTAELGTLTNAYMSDEKRATLLDTNPAEYKVRQLASKLIIGTWTMSAFIIWGLKICLAVFYSRLTARLQNLRLQVRLAYFFIGITWFAVELTILFSCWPMSRLWQINPDPGNLCQPGISRAYIWVYFVLHVITDLYLLYIPLPLLWKENISMRRKINLLSLFSGGIFTMAATVVRTTALLGTDHVNIGLWSCLEIFISIFVTNAPVLYPLAGRWVHNINMSRVARKIQPSITTTQSELPQTNQKIVASASGTDEHGSGSDSNQCTTHTLSGIVVVQEVSVTTGPAPAEKIGATSCYPDPGRNWDFSKRSLGSHWSVRTGAEARL